MDFSITKDKLINSALERFYSEKGYFPKYFNAYNCAEITDIAPTITAACGIQNSSGTVLIIEEEVGK
jgi:hypothetical protein